MGARKSGGSNSFFNGVIDQVQIFDYVLSAEHRRGSVQSNPRFAAMNLDALPKSP